MEEAVAVSRKVEDCRAVLLAAARKLSECVTLGESSVGGVRKGVCGPPPPSRAEEAPVMSEFTASMGLGAREGRGAVLTPH